MPPLKKFYTKGALFVRMLVFEKELVVSISLYYMPLENRYYMPLENRKRKQNIFILGRFNQTLSKYIPAENKIRKYKNSEDFLLNTKQVFSGRNLESISGEYGR